VSGAGAPPHCSVVVPTRGRPELLGACLASIAGSRYPLERLEAVVADDSGSADGTVAEVVAASRGGLEVQLVETARRGPAAARNAAAKHAGGTVLAFTDDDCLVHSDWLARLVAAAQGGATAGGRTINGLPDNRWAAMSQQIVDLVYAHSNRDPGDPQFLGTNNLAVGSDVFREAGGFDESYLHAGGEDRAFCRKWRALGLPLRYEPRALVEHKHALTLQTFLRQHFDYGRGSYRFHSDAAREGDGRVREALRFQASAPRLLLAEAARDGGATGVAGTASRFVMWQAANAAGMAWEAALSALGDGRERLPGARSSGP
jgi:GT2 family glycosyltransferase